MDMDKDHQQSSIAHFYREEFVKHKLRLVSQKDFYSEKTFQELDAALDKIISEMDHISRLDDFSELASHLLSKIDFITHLSVSPSGQNHRVH
jgi:hypothetical protein